MTAAVAVTVLPAITYAQDPGLTVSQPNGSGTMTIDVFIPNIGPAVANAPPGSGLTPNPPKQNVGDITMPIAVPAKNGNGQPESYLDKANLIAGWINSVYGAPPNVASVTDNGNGTATINLPNNALILVEKDTTKEKQLKVVAAAPPVNVDTILDWSGSLAGLDADGGISDFSASLGYDGLTDSASLSYNQLASPTLNSLTTAMFSQLDAGLPAALQADLVLDLTDDQIIFNDPDGITGAFMSNATTDTDVELSGGVTPTIPEPGSLLLLGIGVLGVIGAARCTERTRA